MTEKCKLTNAVVKVEVEKLKRHTSASSTPFTQKPHEWLIHQEPISHSEEATVTLSKSKTASLLQATHTQTHTLSWFHHFRTLH